MAVYGIVNGRVYQAAVSEETSKHQISWQLGHDDSAAQTFNVVIYDEDGLTAYRKVLWLLIFSFRISCLMEYFDA